MFAMTQVYVEEHLNPAGFLHIQNLHILGFMINFIGKRKIIPIFIIALKFSITLSVSREFVFHIPHNLDEPTYSSLWKKTLITVYQNEWIFHLVPWSWANLHPRTDKSQKQMNHKKQLERSLKHSTEKQEVDKSSNLSSQNFTKTKH